MPYSSNGTLTSSKLTINDSDGWDTQSEWEAAQSQSKTTITNGIVELSQISETVMEDWESQSFSNYGGDTADWSFDTSTPLEGAASASPSTGSGAQIFSSSGLPVYPQRGDTIRGYFYSTPGRSNNDDAFGFALQTDPIDAGYHLVMAPDLGTNFGLSVGTWDSVAVQDNGVSVPTGQTVEWEIEFGDPTITAKLYDAPIDSGGSVLSTISTDDSQYDNGGVSFQQNSGSPTGVEWDYVRVVR